MADPAPGASSNRIAPAALYDTAPCGLLTTGPTGTIITANATMSELVGLGADELIGRKFVSLLTPGGAIYHETHYMPTLQMHGTAREIALELRRSDGVRVPVLVNAALEDASGDHALIHVAVFAAAERRRYERELMWARQRAEASEARASTLVQTLQRTLLPHRLPTIRDLDVAAVYRPAAGSAEIGGDFYDVFQVDEQEWVVAIGDVQGKGVAAAVVTALARYTIRAAAVEHERPSEVLQVLNDVLVRDETDRYCTAVIIRCRRARAGWHLAVACGGHPIPLLLRRGGSPVELGVPGTIVGFFDDVQFSDVRTELDPGDMVLVYTDGVSEARHDTHMYGEDRVGAILREHAGAGVHHVTAALVDDVLEFEGGLQHDDIAVVALQAQPS